MDDFLMLSDSEMSVNSAAQISDLSKALLAPGSVDNMYNTPGGSLTMQSLEGMLADLTLHANDFTLWQDLNKIKAFSTVEEYDQQIGLGISDGGFVGLMESPEFSDPDFLKQIAIVKFMSEGWKVSDVQEATNTIVNVRTRQQRSAMNRLLRNLNRALYNGNSAWIPESVDGLATTIAATSSQQVYDMRGGSISMSTLNLIGQLITEGNGNADGANIYASPAGIQNLSTIIESDGTTTNNRKIIKSGDGSVTIGGRITEVMTNFGAMKPRLDKVLGLEFEAQSVPQYYNNASKTWVEGASSDKAPSAPTIAKADNTGVSGSLFSGSGVRPSGVVYRYRVSARNKYGRSVACAAVSSGSVASGGAVTLTITPSQADAGDKTPTCFVIYSEKVAASGDYKYLDTVAASASNPLAAVTYQDKNLLIPGTARMFVIDQTSAGEQRVIAYSQLLPIHNTDLAKTGRYTQGLINLYGAMKYYKPNVLVEIRNIGVSQTTGNLFNTI